MKMTSHLVNDVSVGFSQNHRHGAHISCEFESVRFLPVKAVAENCGGVLGLHHVNRPNGNPSNTNDLIHVGFIDGLRRKSEIKH